MLFALLVASVRPDGAPVDAASEEVDAVDRDYTNELPRIPPTDPADALATFQIEPGFHIELAAAEPLVVDPVALEFDERGRLWVVEMRGYSEDGDKGLGRIRVLEDADDDGRFDTSTVFADGLNWPTALTCFDGGVFVGVAPDILYLKDTNGDGKADERRVVLTGFHRTNLQGLLNSFRWGLDNRIHVATSSCGGDVRRPDQPESEAIALRTRDCSFDPRTFDVRPTTGGAQHGMSFDGWGNKFLCSNSDHLQLAMIEDRYLGRNVQARFPATRKSIAADGAAAEVFRRSPVEPWRIVRTRLRVKGIVDGPVEGGGRAAGYFTSATGVTVYTGDAWPEEFAGNVFVGDVGSNLVHRKTLEPDGVGQIGRRATEGREFLASTDIWFRPAQFANAPDGNLYIADMYREVIEHPLSLPPVIKRHLDLTSGRDRGRIYRIVRANDDDDKSSAKHSVNASVIPPDATKARLIALLDSANGWTRSTASRLLYERFALRDEGEFEDIFLDSTNPMGRVQILNTMASFGLLDSYFILTPLHDPHPRVREHAVRLAEQLLVAERESDDDNAHNLREAILRMVADDDPRVRFQVAFTLGAMEEPKRIAALAALAKRDGAEPFARAAIYSALAEGSDALFERLFSDDAFRQSNDGMRFLSELAAQIGARADEAELTEIAETLAGGEVTPGDAAKTAASGRLLMDLFRGAGPRLGAIRAKVDALTGGHSEDVLANVLTSSRATALDDDASASDRAAAIARLTMGAYADFADSLAELLEPRQPQPVQLAALETLGQFDAPDIARTILNAWSGFSPAVRRQASAILVSRGAWAGSLLTALETNALPMNEIDPSTLQRLKTHSDKAVRERSEKLADTSGRADRAGVVAAYRGVLDLTGDVDRGRELFRKNCAICHRREGVGFETGANLDGARDKGADQILVSILDPNREVDPKYLQYTVVTVFGRSVSGVITAESQGSVTLTRDEGKTETVPRADIDELQSSGVSLMPEGLEKSLDQQALADIIQYLRAAE